MSAATLAKPIGGERAYQVKAREALPLLVRQAKAGVPIFYSDLAEELGMPNPRNLNYVLGSIGKSLELLSKQWNADVPPIQCLVVSKDTGLPGEGVGWFLFKKDDFSALPRRQKQAIVQAALQHVFLYSQWDQVLKALDLEPTNTDFSPLFPKPYSGFGGGEGEDHKALKEYVARNPSVVGLRKGSKAGVTEFPLPSGDSLDVSFNEDAYWVAAEVKSARSLESDIVRGLFQCVKYRAVMDAVVLAESRTQDARALLVLESSLPRSLIPLRNILGIEVISGITPKRNRE